MKGRLAIPGLVGIASFAAVFVVFNYVHFHSVFVPRHNPTGGIAYLYAFVMGAINAAVIFAISFVLRDSPTTNEQSRDATP